jgi:hypothetical protein
MRAMMPVPIRSFNQIALLVAGIALAGAFAIAPSPAAAAECPSEQSVLPYAGSDNGYQCAQMHNSGKKSLSPWQTKSWTKSIAFGYPVESHCTWESSSKVTVSQAWTTSSYTATGTNWDWGDHAFAAGVLFTTGPVDKSGYKSGCADHKGHIQNSIERIVSFTSHTLPATGTVGEPMAFAGALSSSSAPDAIVLQVNGHPRVQAPLQNGSATGSWTPKRAGTYELGLVYPGNTSACPSTDSTCGFTPAKTKKVEATVAPASTAATTSARARPRAPSASSAEAEPATVDEATSPNFQLVTRAKTQRMRSALSLSCPEDHALMHAEALSNRPGDVPVKATPSGARVRSSKAARDQRVSLQVTCRRRAAPSLVHDRLGYGTPGPDLISTMARSGVIFGGPGSDRLRVRHRGGVAYGGLGSDMITVHARRGVGVGGPGSNFIAAKGPGRMLLIGGPGHNTLVGSPRGRTLINAAAGGKKRDHVICRSKRNRVLADRRDVVRGPCGGVRRR